MESWEVLRRVIPRGTSHIVARVMHKSKDYVRRWRHPSPDVNDDATGFRNPLDFGCDLIDAAFIIDPVNAGLIPEYWNNYYRQLVRRHENKGFAGSEERRDAGADLLRQAVEAVNALNIEGCTNHTLEQLQRFIEAGTRIKEKVQAELSSRGGNRNVAPLARKRENDR